MSFDDNKHYNTIKIVDNSLVMKILDNTIKIHLINVLIM